MLIAGGAVAPPEFKGLHRILIFTIEIFSQLAPPQSFTTAGAYWTGSRSHHILITSVQYANHRLFRCDGFLLQLTVHLTGFLLQLTIHLFLRIICIFKYDVYFLILIARG